MALVNLKKKKHAMKMSACGLAAKIPGKEAGQVISRESILKELSDPSKVFNL